MKNLRFIGLLVTVVLLAFGLTIACDNGTTKDETPAVGSRYTGTTTGGESVEVIFSNKTIDPARARASGPTSGDYYLIKVGGNPRSSGTIQLSGSTITFIPDDGTPPFTGTIANDILTIDGSVGGSPLSVRATDPNTGTSPGVGGPTVGGDYDYGDISIPTAKGTVTIPPKPTTKPIDSVSTVIELLGGPTVAEPRGDLGAVLLKGNAVINKTTAISVPIEVVTPNATLTIAKGAALYYTSQSGGIHIRPDTQLKLLGQGALVIDDVRNPDDSGIFVSDIATYNALVPGTYTSAGKLTVLDGQLVCTPNSVINVFGDLEVIGSPTTNPVVLVEGALWIGEGTVTSAVLTVTSAEVLVRKHTVNGTGEFWVNGAATLAMTNSKLTIGDISTSGRAIIGGWHGNTNSGSATAAATAALSNVDIVNGTLELNVGTVTFTDTVNVGGNVGKPAKFQTWGTGNAAFTGNSVLNINNGGTLQLGGYTIVDAVGFGEGTGTVTLDGQAVMNVNKNGVANLGFVQTTRGISGSTSAKGNAGNITVVSGGTSKVVINTDGVVNLDIGDISIEQKANELNPGLEINGGVLNIGSGANEAATLTFAGASSSAKALAKINGGTLRIYNSGWANASAGIPANTLNGALALPSNTVMEFRNGGTLLIPKMLIASTLAGSMKFYRDSQLVQVSNALNDGGSANGFWYPLIGTADSRGGSYAGGTDLYEDIRLAKATGTVVGAEYIVTGGFLEVVGSSVSGPTNKFDFALTSEYNSQSVVTNKGAARMSGVTAGGNLILPEIDTNFSVDADSTLTVTTSGGETRRAAAQRQTGAGILSTGTLDVDGTLVVDTGATLRVLGTGGILVDSDGTVTNNGTIVLGLHTAPTINAAPNTDTPAYRPAAITAAGGEIISEGTFNNPGTIRFNHTGSELENDGGTLNTSGTITIATPSAADSGPIVVTTGIVNAGIMNITAGNVNLTVTSGAITSTMKLDNSDAAAVLNITTGTPRATLAAYASAVDNTAGTINITGTGQVTFTPATPAPTTPTWISAGDTPIGDGSWPGR